MQFICFLDYYLLTYILKHELLKHRFLFPAFHMIGLISAYYTYKRLAKMVYSNRMLDYVTQSNYNLQTIHEHVPSLPRPIHRRFNSEVKPNSSPRVARSNSVVQQMLTSKREENLAKFIALYFCICLLEITYTLLL